MHMNMILVKSDEHQAMIRSRANSKFRVQPDQMQKGDPLQLNLVVDPAAEPQHLCHSKSGS